MNTNKLFFTKPEIAGWLVVFLLISVLPFFFHQQLAYAELLLWKGAVIGQVAMVCLLPVLLAKRWWKRVIA